MIIIKASQTLFYFLLFFCINAINKLDFYKNTMINWARLRTWDTSKIKELQSKKFVFALRHLMPYSPFYREFFKTHNLSFYDFKSIDDIKKLPFFSKKDIIPTETCPSQPKKIILQPDLALIKKYAPKSKLLYMGLQKIIGQDPEQKIKQEFKPVHIHFTTGRSSQQIPFLYTHYDLNNLIETGKRIFSIIQASDQDIAVNCFPFAPHLAFWFGFHATTYNNMLALQTGGGKVMGTAKIINALEKMQASLFISMPGYSYHLLRRAVESKSDFSKLNKIIFGGERVCPGLRNKVKELLKNCSCNDPKILATYAMTEGKTAWIQCHEDSGYHLYPDLEYIELVDEDGNPVPEGERGEVVYTSLDWRGSFLLRYRTGDMCQGLYKSEPCEFCGCTTPRLHFDIERRSDYKDLRLTKLKGELVNLNVFYKVIHEISEIEEWQVEIKKKNNDPFDLDELYIHISVKDGIDPSKVEPRLMQLIIDEANVSPIVINHSLEEMLQRLGMEKEIKEKRIVDLRKK